MTPVSFIAARFLRFRKEPGKKDFVSFVASIAVAGIALGVSALLITVTILGGFENEIKEKVIGFSSPVHVLGFQNQLLPRYRSSMKLMYDSIPQITSASPFVAKEGMVRFSDQVEGIMVKGIIPDSGIISVKKYLSSGSFSFGNESDTVAGCVIGKKLAGKLRAVLGDTVAVFATTGSAADLREARILPFRIDGLYESGMSEFDDVYFFVTIHSAQKLFNIGEKITGFDITVARLDNAEMVSDRIMELLPYPHYSRTVYQSYRNLFTWIELQKEPTPLILGLIIVVATVNIIGTLLMLVLEKTRQIGILRAMGMTQKAIRQIFLTEGLIIGLLGTVIGNLFAGSLCFLQWKYHLLSLPSSIYFMSSVPILFRAENFIIVSGITLLLSLLASYIPALLASKIDPIKSIRFR